MAQVGACSVCGENIRVQTTFDGRLRQYVSDYTAATHTCQGATMLPHVKVLDHGYVKLIEAWGSDARIIESARMSTNKGFKGWGTQCTCVMGASFAGPKGQLNADPECKTCKGTGTIPGDEKLLKFLYEHKHDTPFEFAGLVIEVEAPLMVFREWHRHRTQSYNEMSARYTPMPDTNYIPSAERCLVVNGANKQANALDGTALTHERVLLWLGLLDNAYKVAESVYQTGLQWGIPKELARLPVPVGRYSRMRASTNLRNWLAFLTLRSDKNPHAQYEIRQYANVVGEILTARFPRTMELFNAGL